MSEVEQIPKVTFLCGDTFEIRQVANSLDEEGFVICPSHKCRRQGWIGLPKVLKHASPDGEILRPEYGFGMDYLAVERYVLFGEKPDWMTEREAKAGAA